MSTRSLRVPLLLLTLCLGVLPPASADEPAGIREVTASPRQLIPLQTRVRYTTMIVLPDDEEILDVLCGDKDFWVISATQHLAHVKPAKAGAATNLNLVTARGTVYAFLLTESSTGTPDLAVYVTPDPGVVRRPTPRFYTAAQVEDLQAALTAARAAVTSAQEEAAEQVARHQQQYPTLLRFDYRLPAYSDPFRVRAVWHDGRFTYLQTDAAELPALYELVDGQPALVNFQVHDGTYVVPKVLTRGYLALGKAKFPFVQRGR